MQRLHARVVTASSYNCCAHLSGSVVGLHSYLFISVVAGEDSREPSVLDCVFFYISSLQNHFKCYLRSNTYIGKEKINPALGMSVGFQSCMESCTVISSYKTLVINSAVQLMSDRPSITFPAA